MSRFVCYAVLTGWLMSGLAFSQQPDAPLQILDINNKTIKATDIKLDEKGSLVAETADGSCSLEWQKIVEILFSNPSEKKTATGWEIILNNSDVLYGEIKDAAKNGFVLESSLLGKCEIQFENILMIKSPAASGISYTPTAEDIIQLRNGDRDKGVIKQVGSNNATIQSSIYQKERGYELKEILWIALSQLAQAPQIKDGPVAVLISRDNSRVTAQIKKIENNIFSVKSAYGEEYQLPFGRINYLHTKTPCNIYLSDLEPAKAHEYSPLDNPEKPVFFLWTYQKDRSVVGKNFISLKGKRFYKGLGVHAISELIYRLDGQYQKFFATIGLDDESGSQGNVQFLIYLDGKKSYDSGVVKWGDEPKEVELSVVKAREMRLVLTEGEDKMYTLDRAAWANARLTK